MNPLMTICLWNKANFFVNNDFICASDSTCCIDFYVDKYNYSFLIDTGASICAIKYKHVIGLNIPLHKEIIKINGIGGSIEAIGYVYLTLSNCYDSPGHSFEHKFYVFNSLPCKAHAILGQDFLSKFNAILNLNCSTLTLKNNIILPLRSSFHCFILPPRSESIHYIQTKFTEECLVCSSELQEEVFLASTLVKPINGLIPILILNTSEKEVCLDNIQPTIQNVSEYNVCTFNQCKAVNSDRVKNYLAY